MAAPLRNMHQCTAVHVAARYQHGCHGGGAAARGIRCVCCHDRRASVQSVFVFISHKLNRWPRPSGIAQLQQMAARALRATMLLGAAALLLPSAATAAAADGLVYFAPAASHNISFDSRSAIIDGQPTLMLSGAVHYTRVHEQEWGRVFDLAVEMGLNVIQTYVFWNAHETTADQVWLPR